MPVPDGRILKVAAPAFLAELNSKLSEWSVGVTAQRNYSVQYDIKSLATLHIDVQVLTLDADIEDKAAVKSQYGFNVVCQKKVDKTDVQAIDQISNLVIAIYEHWQQEDHIGDLESTFLMERDVMPYSPTLLEAKSICFGTAAFVFGETR